MSEKSFVTSYDKDCEEFANTLMTLVSNDKSLCNIKRSHEEFKKDRSIVSGEYVLTIGNKASRFNKKNFKDIYCDFGIHFGYYGTKAWISCESFKWNDDNLFKFNTELISLLDELGMNTDNIDEKAYKFLKNQRAEKEKNKNQTGLTLYDEAYATILTSIAVNNLLLNHTNKWLRMFKWFKDFLSKSERRKNQYKYAVILFYHRYISDFLNMDEDKDTVKD